MNRKVLITIMIIIGAIALTYIIFPDLVIGPFDDGVVLALASCAEAVLFAIHVVKKSSRSRVSSNNSNSQKSTDTHSSNYQSNYQNTTNSNYTNYQQNNQNSGTKHDADNQEDEFQFFAGCTNWEQVKSRYRDLMKIYHPDAGGHEESSKKINLHSFL